MPTRQQSYPTGNYGNTGANQNFGNQYFTGNPGGNQMRVVGQQNEMMVGGQRYSKKKFDGTLSDCRFF